MSRPRVVVLALVGAGFNLGLAVSNIGDRPWLGVLSLTSAAACFACAMILAR